MHLQQMIAGDGAGARDRRAAGVAGGDQARRLGVGDQRDVIVGALDRAEARFRQPHALLRQLAKIGCLQARLKDHRAGDDAHAARPVVGKAALRGDCQRLDALDVAWPARHMHLRRRDRGRGAAVQVAFQIADGALARRVVAERDVDVRVDQAGDRRHAAGVDHHIGFAYGVGRRGADRCDALAVDDDRVAGCERLAPVAGNDLTEIDDGDFHGRAVASCQFTFRPSSSASW